MIALTPENLALHVHVHVASGEVEGGVRHLEGGDDE